MLPFLFYAAVAATTVLSGAVVVRMLVQHTAMWFPQTFMLCAASCFTGALCFLCLPGMLLPYVVYATCYPVIVVVMAALEVLAVIRAIWVLARHFPNFRVTGNAIAAISVLAGVLVSIWHYKTPNSVGFNRVVEYARLMAANDTLTTSLAVCLGVYWLLVPHTKAIPLRPAAKAFTFGLMIWLIAASVEDSILPFSTGMTIRWIAQIVGAAGVGVSCLIWFIFMTPKYDVGRPAWDVPSEELERLKRLFRSSRDLKKSVSVG